MIYFRRFLFAAFGVMAFIGFASSQQVQQSVNSIVASSCTNQFIRAIAATGLATCATIGSADVSGSYTGITGTGTLAAGATGSGFTVNLTASTISNRLPAANTGSAPASWTPIDTSGASLVFTGVSANYQVIGNMVFAYASLTYPATADVSAANLGGLPVTTANAAYSRQCTLSYTAVTTASRIVPNQNATSFQILTATGGTITNATFSSQLVIFLCIYPVV